LKRIIHGDILSEGLLTEASIDPDITARVN